MAEPIRTLVDNLPFEGAYTLAGPMIVVSCAYGTKRAVLGLFKPQKLAKILLRKMVLDAQAVTMAQAALPIAVPRVSTAAH